MELSVLLALSFGIIYLVINRMEDSSTTISIKIQEVIIGRYAGISNNYQY